MANRIVGKARSKGIYGRDLKEGKIKPQSGSVVAPQLRTDQSANASWVKSTGKTAPKGTYVYDGGQKREVGGRAANKSFNDKVRSAYMNKYKRRKTW